MSLEVRVQEDIFLFFRKSVRLEEDVSPEMSLLLLTKVFVFVPRPVRGPCDQF